MKRVLLVKLSSLGDIAHALPVARALKSRLPEVHLTWLAQPEYRELLSHCPDVDAVVSFPRHRFLRGLPALWRGLRAEPFDAVLDLQGLAKSAFPARLAKRRGRAPVIGPAWAREGAPLFYTLRPVRAPGPRRHAVDENLDVAALYAPPVPGEPPPRPRIAIAPDPGPTADPDGLDVAPRIAFAPFSRWQTKNWPVESFAELGRRLHAEVGARVFILGGPGDAPAAVPLARQIPHARSLCGAFSVVETFAFLQTVDLCVSVDSGPLHWADALGVPVVSLYGATDPVRTGPYWQPESVLTADLPCRPCHRRECAQGGDIPPCLATLSVEAVFARILALL